MKKLMVSLVAAPLLLSVVASADIDVKVGGQAVVYYETHQDDGNSADIFDQMSSLANAGLQLNFNSDLKNNFSMGAQLSYLGTLGLEKSIVSNVAQISGQLPVPTDTSNPSTTNELALSKIFVAKKIANTTMKLGRQELPKSLSPLAFSEGWRVFKNTFDAILAVNSDLPKTTIVGAYVGQSNSTIGTGLSTMTNLNGGGPNAAVTGAAYMLTAQTKLIPLTTLTLSYYGLNNIGAGYTAGVVPSGGKQASAMWADAQIGGKALPAGIKLGLQGGQISLEDGDTDTTAFGAKIGATVGPVYLQAAYSSVNDGDVALKNTGTGVKTPLYTQMILNQNAIAKDADTIHLKGVLGLGDYGKVIAAYGMTSGGDKAIEGKVDYNELDVIYKVKAGGVSYFASAMIRTWSEKGKYLATTADTESDNRVRIWARYNF